MLFLGKKIQEEDIQDLYKEILFHIQESDSLFVGIGNLEIQDDEELIESISQIRKIDQEVCEYLRELKITHDGLFFDRKIGSNRIKIISKKLIKLLKKQIPLVQKYKEIAYTEVFAQNSLDRKMVEDIYYLMDVHLEIYIKIIKKLESGTISAIFSRITEIQSQEKYWFLSYQAIITIILLLTFVYTFHNELLSIFSIVLFKELGGMLWHHLIGIILSVLVIYFKQKNY